MFKSLHKALTLCTLSLTVKVQTLLAGSMATSLRMYMENRGSCRVNSNTWNWVLIYMQNNHVKKINLCG
ncbi:hypothetical protein DPMN_008097 [Dreissena polymorpha]|uniref:Secreted protein n=1 Tax=Dreissena polymorpha TaxID=45954 RepID=A0A9D4MY56_DREPO|nr:hypothetical protein DPMN_008097 [Dreissena polymorpha]